jgi:hypothetical protein
MTGPAGTAMQVPVGASVPAGPVTAVQLSYTSRRPAAIRLGGTTKNVVPRRVPAARASTYVDRLDTAPTGVIRIIADAPVHHFCVSQVWVGLLGIDTPTGCVTVDLYGAATTVPGDCSRSWPATVAP